MNNIHTLIIQSIWKHVEHADIEYKMKFDWDYVPYILTNLAWKNIEIIIFSISKDLCGKI